MSVKFSKLFDLYKSLDNAELEIKIKNASTEFYKKMEGEYEQSVVIIENLPRKSNSPPTNKRKIINFDGDKKTETMELKQLYGHIFIPQGKITLSREIETKESINYDSSNIKIRIRSRFSSYYKSSFNNEWRIDFTVVKQLNKQEEFKDLKFHVDKYFKGNKKENFESMLKEVSNYEVELELVKADNLDLNEITMTINEIFSVEKGNTIYRNRLAFVSNIINPPQKNQLFLDGKLGFKQLLPSVMTLTKQRYVELFPPIGWFITPKIDGERTLLFISGDYYAFINESSIIDNEETFDINNLSILDGELQDKNYYPFDIIMFEGEKVYQKVFKERLNLFKKYAKIFLGDYKIKIKKFIELKEDNLEQSFKEINKKEDIDGIVFNKNGGSYMTKPYKWKPLKFNTIDFYVEKANDYSKKIVKEMIGKFDGVLYLLYCKASPEQQKLYDLPILQKPELSDSSLIPVLFSPATAPLSYILIEQRGDLHGQLWEVYCDENCIFGGIPKWKLLRRRTEREQAMKNENKPIYFNANAFFVAEDNWNNYLAPLHFEDLWYPSFGYFKTSQSSSSTALRSFLSFVKNESMQIKNSKNVIDIGSGKGQDLHKYFKNKIKELYVVDYDKDALVELNKRRFDISKKFKYSMTVRSVHMDLRNFQKLREFKKFDIMVCNYSIHYFVPNISVMFEFFKVAREIVKEKIIINYFIGEEVIKLFEKNKIEPNNRWLTQMADGKTKYSIYRGFDSHQQVTGLPIKLRLPFTGDEEYEETLIGTDDLIKAAEFSGFKLDKFVCSKKLFDKWDKNCDKLSARDKKENPHLRLKPDDKMMAQLYGYIIFTK